MHSATVRRSRFQCVTVKARARPPIVATLHTQSTKAEEMYVVNLLTKGAIDHS